MTAGVRRINRGASFETAASRPPQDDDKGLIPHTNIRHPEERPAGARLEGRREPKAERFSALRQSRLLEAALLRVAGLSAP
jgi:hypothetical protein